MGDLHGGDGVPNQPRFETLLLNAQRGLLRYILTAVGDAHAADNILQETNMLLLQKAEDFAPGTNFDAWATKVAYWQVKAYCRDSGRDRHVFSEELAGQLMDRMQEPGQVNRLDLAMDALQSCLGKMKKQDQELLSMRYHGELSILAIASRLGKSVPAVKGALQRARRALRKCMYMQKEIGD
ncbi:sigma-70 family RNA polymerase sigma factor [Aeoliella mucimassa]|uniref:RNA polymerase sigma factor n=1 Tax=Aeoliella mucimassa TaxID=2527972 RepID=A0A518AVR3_9BACT|nr:sigma-70 family RNA polymerase sigma factor [Aeoliella mucimassa]QDU58810.1 RNA polymerase sigma factor [Aeoliella mucimassa]